MLCRNYLNLYPLKILKYIFFLIFFLFEYFAEKNEIFYKNIWRGELGIIEISSAAILFLSFLFSYKTLKYSHKRIKKVFFTRSFLFLFLFLEELSFLTKGLLPFANFYNNQNEFNIHNSKFLLEPINGGGNIWLFEINISINQNESEIEKLALAHKNISKFLTKEPKKIIYIPNKIINIVI